MSNDREIALLHRALVWKMDFLRYLRNAFGFGYAGKTVKPKNPRRVEGGKKSAVTRRLNKELAKVNAGATVCAPAEEAM